MDLTAASSIVLVAVTAWYSLLTYRISRASESAADAAKQSADQSRRSADSAERSLQINLSSLNEMRTQRLSASQPLVFGQVEGIICYNRLPEIIHITIRNIGSGPAIAVRGNLIISGVEYESEEAPFAFPITVLPHNVDAVSAEAYLSRSQLRGIEMLTDIEITLKISYRDIYNRSFVVSSRYAIDPPSESLVPIGDLSIDSDVQVAGLS